MPTLTHPIVVIDPGHGGSQDVAGSTADHLFGAGVSEKTATLDLARRVRDRLGGSATVLLTRDSDTNLSLGSRAGFARMVEADYFVSLHFNGHPDPSYDSTEVFVSRQSTDGDRLLAQELHRSITAAIGTTAGGVLAADLGVVVRDRHASATNVALLEICDLTNSTRAGSATNPAFLDTLAAAVCAAIQARLAVAGNGVAPLGLVRAQDLDTDVRGVLELIRVRAQVKATAGRHFADTDRFVQVLRSRYLDRYLASPSPITGLEAIARIGAQNTSGVVTTICGTPDRWEQMTPALNSIRVPGLSDVPGLAGLLDDVGAATAVLTVANRRELDHIDGPFLLGRHDVDGLDCAARSNAALDPDLAGGNDINESQLMHWATGVKYHDWSDERIRDLFVAYELWHLELWDVFGRDPINDLIAEDAGWHLARSLRNGTVGPQNLLDELDRCFRDARAWVGGLLTLRRDQLDAQILAETPPTAHIHWTGDAIDASQFNHPYRAPSVRQLLRDGRPVDEVLQSRLVDNYAAVYALIFEAETNPQHVSGLQRLMASGDLDWAFRRFGEPGGTTTSGLGVARVRSLDESGPLSDEEWTWVESWQARGVVGIDRLIADPAANARLVAGAIFCGRHIVSPSENADPLLCVDPAVTAADPRAQALIPHVTARGPIIDWPSVPSTERLRYVVARLVDGYGYPVNGAAGIVGNLTAESEVVPSRLEGSALLTPMRSLDFANKSQDWEPAQVMNRDEAAKQGPLKPGVGLAQWTWAPRRRGLFAHRYGNRPAGTGILFDLDAQIDYLVTELRTSYAAVEAVVMNPAVTVDAASDEVVYSFETPGSVLDAHRDPLPRADPAVQAVFAERRAMSQRAKTAYEG
ncbi:phage tail tip lysozyme [Kribbella endophytica]